MISFFLEMSPLVGLLTKHPLLLRKMVITIILSPHLRHLSSQYDQFHKQVRQEVL